MIIGIGTDIVNIARIAGILRRHGDRFIARVFAPTERTFSADHPSAPAHYAKRFAAKEAAAKAMGIGIDGGVYLRDLIVEKSDTGAPVLHLAGGAATRAAALNHGNPQKIHLSLSDDGGFALAFVVMEDAITP